MTPHQASLRPKNTDKDKDEDSASNVERRGSHGSAHNMTSQISNAPGTRTANPAMMRVTKPKNIVTMNWKTGPPEKGPQAKEKGDEPAPSALTERPAQSNEQMDKRMDPKEG